MSPFASKCPLLIVPRTCAKNTINHVLLGNERIAAEAIMNAHYNCCALFMTVLCKFMLRPTTVMWTILPVQVDQVVYSWFAEKNK
jgi:hypothetical protein